MKKLLLALFSLPVLAFGQGSQDFENTTSIPGAYGDGNFTESSITYTFVHSRDVDVYPISGAGLMLRRASDSYLEFTVTGGVGSFDFDYKKAFTGAANRQLELMINGTAVATSAEFGPGTDTTIYHFSHNVNVAGTVTVKIKLTGSANTNRQTVIDNIVWTGYTGTPSTSCDIEVGAVINQVCNDATTTTDPLDDFLTFSLIPEGANAGTSYNISAAGFTITPATGVFGDTTLFALAAGSAGAGDIVITVTSVDSTSCSSTVTLTNNASACSSATPVLTVAPATLNTFTHMVGTPAASQIVTVSGLTLTTDVIVTATTGFEVSLDQTTYAATVTLPITNGALALDTVYVRGNSAVYGAYTGTVSFATTGVTTFDIAVEGFANDYVATTIGAINGVDANGSALNLNDLVDVVGVVHCGNTSATGYNFVIIDGNGDGINIFSNAAGMVANYQTVTSGDSIRVKGKVSQFNGLLQLSNILSIDTLATGADLTVPTAVTALSEATENKHVKLENVKIKYADDATIDLTDIGSGKNIVFESVANPADTFMIRITPAMTGFDQYDFPLGPINLTGIGAQFDSSNPFTSGYQLFPTCGASSVSVICAGANLPNNGVTVVGAELTANAQWANYQWINCADSLPIAGATNRVFTATADGSYAVIVSTPVCSSTSACTVIQGLGIDATFANGIAAFPNPVAEQLTITYNNNVLATATITDINGKIVVNNITLSNATLINTSEWSKGVYFVNIIGANNEAHTMKVVK